MLKKYFRVVSSVFGFLIELIPLRKDYLQLTQRLQEKEEEEVRSVHTTVL